MFTPSVHEVCDVVNENSIHKQSFHFGITKLQLDCSSRPSQRCGEIPGSPPLYKTLYMYMDSKVYHNGRKSSHEAISPKYKITHTALSHVLGTCKWQYTVIGKLLSLCTHPAPQIEIGYMPTQSLVSVHYLLKISPASYENLIACTCPTNCLCEMLKYYNGLPKNITWRLYVCV